MSVVQACADAEAAIARARSLFGARGGIDGPNSASEITGAAQTAAAGRDRTLDMAGGVGLPSYRDMVDRSIPPLTTAATSDSGLATHLVTAAAVTNAGATQLDGIAAQTRTISAAAPTARTAADQRAILTALRGQLQQASQAVQTTQQQDSAAATQIRTLRYPKDAPASSGDRVQALDDGKKPPPHGHDPRYWVDITKIIEVPDGGLAPRGYVQIGPNQWYPFEDNQMSVHPPPDPVKYPLDMHDIQHLAPGSLGPTGTTELAPGWFTPDPRHFYGPQPPWVPQQPVDIRDIIRVPAGEQAPWGYKEYLPGWFAPDITFNTPPTMSRCNED
jgi:hypothetical protein